MVVLSSIWDEHHREWQPTVALGVGVPLGADSHTYIHGKRRKRALAAAEV